MYLCAHVCSAHGDKRRAPGPSELEVQVVMSHAMWVLAGTPQCANIRSQAAAMENVPNALLESPGLL